MVSGRLHSLRAGTKHPAAPEPAFARGKQSGCENGQSRPLPQPVVHHRAQRHQPSVSGEQQHGERHGNHQHRQQDLVHRQLRAECPMDRVERRTPAEHHQATETDQGDRRTDRKRTGEHAAGGDYETVHTNPICRRVRTHQRRHPGTEQGPIRTRKRAARRRGNLEKRTGPARIAGEQRQLSARHRPSHAGRL